MPDSEAPINSLDPYMLLMIGEEFDSGLAVFSPEQLLNEGLALLVSKLDKFQTNDRPSVAIKLFQYLLDACRNRGLPSPIEFFFGTVPHDLESSLREAFFLDSTIFFELAWEEDTKPDIGLFLEECPEGYAADLLDKLIIIEIRERRSRNEDALALAWRSLRTYCDSSTSIALVFCRAFGLPAPGSELGKYRLERLVGIGGMGVVYRARNLGANRVCALKVMRPDRDSTVRFKNEVRRAAKIDHERLIPALDADLLHPERPYYTMRYVKGGRSLLDITLNSPHSDNRKVAQLILGIVQACQALESARLVHCDLKPSNVLLDKQSKPLVTDLGLSEFRGRIKSGPSDEFAGTAEYASPEQAASNHTVTTSTDIWGIGAILYWLLTGNAPFARLSPGETLQETLRRVCEEKVSPPRGLNKDCSRELQAICLKCLQKKTFDRYHTLDELADDLKLFLQGKPVRARGYFAIRNMARVCKWPTLLIVIAIALVLLSPKVHQQWFEEPRPIAMSLACQPVVWQPPENVEVIHTKPMRFEADGFEIQATSRYWDLSLWKPVAPDELSTKAVQPAFTTTVVTIRKLELSERTRFFSVFYRTSGLGVYPRARVIATPQIAIGARVKKYEFLEEMPADRRGNRVRSMTTWELVIDLSEVGNDQKPFQLIDHAIWWNGLQDQTYGSASDWVAARFDYPVESADLAIRLPSNKRLTDWGVCDFPSGGHQPFPSSQAPGTYVNHKSGLLYWKFPKPVPNRVYRIDWAWEDR
jgi:hypothetical protein